MRPRTRSPPARPDSASSPSIDRNPLHDAVAVSNAAAAPGSGVGMPAGRGGVRAAHALPSTIANTTATLLDTSASRFDFLFDGGAIDLFAVTGEGALPRRDGRGELSLLGEHVAVMILDH